MNHHATDVVHIAGLDLEYRPFSLDDDKPTGAQIAALAGFKPEQLATVIQVLPSGVFEGLRPDENVRLADTSRNFLVFEADRLYYFAIDGQRYDWPCPIINGHTLRKISNAPAGMRLLQQLEDEPDRDVSDDDTVQLGGEGIEKFVTRKAIWKLNVQGQLFDFDKPTVLVQEAAERAGINLRTDWKITLQIAGQGRQEKLMSDVIDLRAPGIEKLRFSQKDVVNGEAPALARREFNLLPIDSQHLEGMGLRWETCLNKDGRRWLLIHDYELPVGYSHERVLLALEIPIGYPVSALDMFYLFPHVTLLSGAGIPNVHITAEIDSHDFQGWSRHRGANGWDPQTDNVTTQLALAEGCLLKEVDL